MQPNAHMHSETSTAPRPSQLLTPALAIETASGDEWERYVLGHPQATSAHLWGWGDVLEETFGHTPHFFLARRAGVVCGALPLVAMKSLLFGRFLASMPYLNYGGLLADDQPAEDALLARAVALAGALHLTSIEFRHREQHAAPSVTKSHKVTMELDLSRGEEGLWKSFDPKLRNQIRKPQRSGLLCEIDPPGALEAFYAVFSRNMRDLGTPVYPPSFFRAVRRAFPGHTHILVVKKGETPVAAGFLFHFRDRVEIPWASSIRDFNSLSPNNLLYWDSIRFAISEGARLFDMGRSTPDEGTYKFKAQWGAKPAALHWQYWLAPGEEIPERNPKNRKFQIAIQLWQRLPLDIAETLGPVIARGLP